MARLALADKFQCLLLDCDGVLWSGAEPIAGSAEAMQALKAAGKKFALVTNASAKTRAAVARRATETVGVTITAADVVTSGSVAAAALASRSITSAYVIGAPGLHEELRLAGISIVSLELPDSFDESALRRLACDAPEVGAVVVGHDEAFSYNKLALACMLLQLRDSCLLLGTNPDVGNRDKAGYLVPEAGALIAAVEAVTGRKALVTGKPSPLLIQHLLEKHKLAPNEVLMVGDRLDTDIAFGAAGGVETCLVLTGVSTADEAAALPADRRPSHVRASLEQVVFGES